MAWWEEFRKLAGAQESRPSLEEALLEEGSVAKAVHRQLRDDFPESALGWIESVRWEGPRSVPLNQIDMAGKERWEAYHHPAKVREFAEKLSRGVKKPVILMRTPHRQKLVALDGHHRILASVQIHRPVLAYITTIDDPALAKTAEELHSAQKRGPSL